MGRNRPSNTQNRQFWQTGKMNNATYAQYFNRLTELSVSMFDWQNLPDSVDPRYLELALFGDGHAIFFKDEVLGFLALRCMIGGTWDVYQIPTFRRAYATNGYQMELNPENSVIIYNNMIRTNSTLDVAVFANRLWELDRSIDVNAKAQKTPVLILCDEKQRLTMKNLYMKYEGNEPFIFGDNSLANYGDSLFRVLKTDAPYVADKLYTLKTQIWNEALTYLGISNVNVSKKERLITDEVQRNQGGTIASRYSRLESRRQACEKINKMFGLDIWVDYREDYRTSDEEYVLPSDSEGEELREIAEEVKE